MTRLAFATALAVIVGGSMAACSPAATSPAASEATPVAGGTLTLGVGIPLQDFDPYQGANVNYIITKTLYSALITYTSDLKPEPDLAVKWKIADDNRSVTITLRDTVFADGSPLTSADVVAGVKRALDPAIGFTQGGVAQFISSAAAVDEHTVKVDFTEPTSEDRVLDWMSFFPVVKAADNNPGFLKTKAAGSGPFMVDSYKPGTQLTLVKNPNYYKKGHPYLDKVEYRFFSDQDGMVAALQAGNVDGTVWQQLHYDSQLKGQFQLISGSLSAQTQLFYVNPGMAPFDNADCRKAVMRAVDRESIRKAVQGTDGVIVPGPFPPSSPAFDKKLFDKVGFDLAAAKQGIAKSCATKTATAALTPSAGVGTALPMIQADLAKVGFDLKLETMDTPTFISLVRTGKVQVAVFPTVNPFRSVASLATNRGFSGGDNSNYWWAGQGVPQDYKDALEAVESAITPSAVAAANAQFNKALVNDSWATGLYTMIDRAVMSQQVHDFKFALGSQLVLDDTFLTK